MLSSINNTLHSLLPSFFPTCTTSLLPEPPRDNNQPSSTSLEAHQIKPCCACPDTKRSRDDCFLRYGPPNESEESREKCAQLIAAHRACMEQYGFRI